MPIPEASKVGLPLMNLIRYKGLPILKQLHLEEQLLRTSSRNWCIINDGTSDPTIVMGLSGNPSELLEIEAVIKDEIPVIRRFTGGGTVIVDPGTIFVTFICNRNDVPGVQPYPHSIMHWSGLLYNETFRGIGDFQLRENDYVFGDLKFGGNAQSITKKRWIHHTSFLWDFEARNMAYLKQPKKAPQYSLARSHVDFICRMKEYMTRSSFIERTVKATANHFSVEELEVDVDATIHDSGFEHSTRLLSKQELEGAMSNPTSSHRLKEETPYLHTQ